MRELSERDLEAVLRDAGSRLAYPEPDLVAAVRARVRERGARGMRPRFGLVPALVTAALLAFVIFAGGPAASTAVEILRLRGVDIFRVPVSASPTRSPSSPTASPTGTALIPGRRVSLDEARRTASFPIRVPADARLGVPDEVYLDGRDRVTLVYLSRRGLPPTSAPGVSALIVELGGQLDAGFLGKGVGPGTRIEDVTVNGARGFWLEGDPHFFFYRAAGGQILQETLRLAGNTLLWQDGEVTYRIEAHVTRDEALAIASSLR